MEDYFDYEGSGLELFDLSDVLENLGKWNLKKLLNTNQNLAKK